MKCLSPSHTDKNASMKLLSDINEEQVWCYGCLKKDERILTSLGWKEIQNIDIGNIVIDVSGKPTKVTRKEPKQATEPLLCVKTSTDNIGLYATADHTMLWVPDPISTRGEIRSDYKKVSKIYEIELKDLRQGQWLPTAIIKEDGNVNNLLFIKTDIRQATFDIHDPELAWILGLYAAEGSVQGGRSVSFSIHEDEVNQFKPKIETWLSKHLQSTVVVSKRTGSKGVDLVVSDVLFARLVSETVGNGCQNKICPDAILRGPLQVAASWLVGLLDGDGSKKKKDLVCTSQDLCDAMFVIALRCGAIPSRRNPSQKEGKKKVYSVGLLYKTYIEIENAAKGLLYEPKEKAHKNACIINLPEIGWILASRIESIESTGRYPTVYDITTESGTFTTTTMSVHNCHATGDIFTVAHWLDNAPINGMEFINDNVIRLAKQFNIPYSDINLSPEQAEKIEWYRFISIVTDRLCLKDERGEPVNWTHKFCEERGWPSKTCEALHIATILDYEKFVKQLQAITGMSNEEIKSKGITPDLFGPDLITISLKDEKGRPVGFTARNLKWDKGSQSPKYKNSSHSPIFEKGSILYGISTCKLFSRRLDVFEGNGSHIVAYAAGHQSSVALSGSSFSEAQVSLIRKLGVKYINLVLDNDKTGKDKTNEYMQKLSGIEGLRVECTTLEFKPEDLQKNPNLKDPEDYIKLYGLNSYFKNKPISAFQWMLDKEAQNIKNGNISPIDFANKMVKIIFNTENRIERGKQISRLAELTGVSERDIRDEMDRQTKNSVNDVKTSLAKKIASAKNVDDIEIAIEETKSRLIDTTAGKESTKLLSLEESVESFNTLITTLDQRKPGLQGWTSGFSLIDNKISGIFKPLGKDEEGRTVPIPGSLIGLPGAPQHCKSTLIQNIALNVARHNEDVTVLYWALDDSRQRVIERMLSIFSGIPWRKITRRDEIDIFEKQALNNYIEEYRELVLTGRLVHKDHSCGSTLPVAFKWVEAMQDRFQRPILLIIDSFHKIHQAESDVSSPYMATKRTCENLKSFVQTHCITVMASIEMNKGQQRGIEPELLNMTEARKIEYDFDTLATVFNHFYDMDGNSDQVIRKPNGLTEPLIKVNFRKSKDGGTGPIYMALNTTNFRMTDYSIDDIQRITNLTPVTSTNIGGITISPPDIGNLKQQTVWESVDCSTGEIRAITKKNADSMITIE